MPARLRFVPLFLFAALGCGLHLHRPRDAATAEGADGELKASRLVDGFTEELVQSQAMLTEEVAAAQAWAEVGRNRDLLDILGARGEADPEVEALYFLRCRNRYKGDGWTTLCSKISTRLHALTGHAFPLAEAPPPVSGTKTRAIVPVAAPDPAADLLRDLRTLQRHWKGPDSDESQLARAVNEHQLAARALRLGSADAAAPGCPLFDPPGRAPVLQASIERQRGLCRDRRDNLVALDQRVVCRGSACGSSEIGAVVTQLLAVHDAVQQYNDELSRRLYAYESAKQPCSASEPARRDPKFTPAPAPAGPSRGADPGQPGAPGLSSGPDAPARPEPTPTAEPSTPRPASVAARLPARARTIGQPVASATSFGRDSAARPAALSLSFEAGSSGHVASTMSMRQGPFEPALGNMSDGTGPLDLPSPAPFTMFLGAGLIGQPWPALAAPGAPNATPGSGPTTAAPATAATAPPTAPTTTASPAPGALAQNASTNTASAPVFTPGVAVCDDRVLQARFAALADIPIPAVLTAHDLRPLAELGRRWQLGEQLAAVDALIEAAQLRARRKAAADDDAAAAKALAGAPRFARALHATIVGIDRLQKTVDTLELAILALIRETLRVEHDALAESIGLAERRLRLARAKLTAQLDEAVLLMEAHAALGRLERSGCTAQALMPAYEAGRCRDELTKSLVAFGNAWTLGRANEKRADALDLGVRHEASIARSRAAMALRQVYLAAGVTELVKFTRGGMAPEALAQLIVSTVGFGVLAGAVIAK